MNTSKGKNFTIEEDQLLCHIYLDVSQDPIHGVNQKKDKIWERITTLWNQQKPHQYEVRSSYSLQSRFSNLSYVISKFRGAVRQVEYTNPSSGASEIDIMTKAKKLMWDDTSYKKSKKFQFEHVWSILKDAEKWMDTTGMVSAQPQRRKNSLEGGQSSSHTSKSSSTPSFKVDLNVDVDADEQEFINEELSSSYRPIGTKKQILEENRRLKELVEKNMSDRCAFSAKHEQYAATKLEIQRQREDNKIMLMSLDSISDPKDREYFEMRKNEIRQKELVNPNNNNRP
uniref:uncharacterized protein LOC105350044 n=1 Tax=Fragaria vesca subsp. vesca TaxID=101020 RepID=UPI0005C7E829|nr:PREDICTED: uncharacterized protein LOC105350044 [Fragaria vesca subsp. vesca]